jgi:hypothetical protein
MNDQCSELFERVFDSNHGGCVIDCACGRVHFDGIPEGGWSWEPGELEELIRKAGEIPDKYVQHDGTVGSMNISGAEIVYGCSCDLARKFEANIIANAERIAEYLNKRAAAMREKADKIEVK